MSWETDVVEIIADSHPREAFELAKRWQNLSQQFERVAETLASLQGAPSSSTPGWRGRTADAFVEYLKRLTDDTNHLISESAKVSGSLTGCANQLCNAISRIPVPLYNDRDLPNLTDIENLAKGDSSRLKNSEQISQLGTDASASLRSNKFIDTGTQFADLLRVDIAKNRSTYAPGGFLKDKEDAWTDDGTMAGERRVDLDKSRSHVMQPVNAEEEDAAYRQWYETNQGYAAAARGDLVTVYREQYNGGGLDAKPTRTAGATTTGTQDGSHPSGLPKTTGGADFTPNRSSLTGADPGPFDFGAGSGLAGAGEFGPGLGPDDGGVPGQVRPGSASAGPLRAPMPPLTDARLAAAQFAAARNAGGAGGTGMMGGGAGGGRGAGAEGGETTTWLTEDEDVWGLGAGDDLPPAVLGR